MRCASDSGFAAAVAAAKGLKKAGEGERAAGLLPQDQRPPARCSLSGGVASGCGELAWSAASPVRSDSSTRRRSSSQRAASFSSLARKLSFEPSCGQSGVGPSVHRRSSCSRMQAMASKRGRGVRDLDADERELVAVAVLRDITDRPPEELEAFASIRNNYRASDLADFLHNQIGSLDRALVKRLPRVREDRAVAFFARKEPRAPPFPAHLGPLPQMMHGFCDAPVKEPETVAPTPRRRCRALSPIDRSAPSHLTR